MNKNILNISVFILALVLILSVNGAALADELIFPPSLTTIEAEAFMGDTSLDRVTIPSGVTAIKARTFANSSLQSITIPSSVRSVAADAFSGTTPNIYVEDINSLSGNLAGTVYLTGNSTISSSVSYSGATLVVNAGVTLTVTGSLQGTNLIIYGTVVNRGTLRITNEITTLGSGLLSVQNTNTVTELPHNSFYGGLKFSLGTGVQVLVTDEDGNTRTVTVIGTGSHTADVTTAGERVRFCFIPSVTGSYTIYSSDSVDTYVHLINASGVEIAHDDDSLGNRQFKLSYDLTAGNVYFYDVRYYHETSTGTIPFELKYNDPGQVSTEITSHPLNVTATANQMVSFHVEATGSDLTYQWQKMFPVRDTWENTTMGGDTTDTLSFQALLSYSDWEFRCVVTGSDGVSVYSNPASLTFFRSLIMGDNFAHILYSNTQERLLFVPNISGTYTLRSTGSDDPQVYLYDEAGNQLAYNNDGPTDSNFLLSYTLTANTRYYYDISFCDSQKNGYIYLMLTADSGPVITRQPLNVSTSAGETVSFSVTAEGTGTLTYQWQEQTAGSSAWQNSTGSGNRTNRLSFTAQSSHNGKKYRCVVTDGNGFSAISAEVPLYIQSASEPVYRALLIAEAHDEGTQARPQFRESVNLLNNMLQAVTGPTGGKYMIHGGNNEYEDASPTEILSAISSAFAGAKQNDVSLFFIGAHGVSSVDGEWGGAIGTVRSSEGRSSILVEGRYNDLSNFLLIKELAEALSKVPGKVIVLIDTCGSGAGIYEANSAAAGSREDYDSERFAQHVIRTFAAADEEMTEISDLTGELRVMNKFYVLTGAAHKELGHAHWTLGGYLAQGIAGGVGTYGPMPADTDPADGIVTQQEVYSYAYDFTIRSLWQFGQTQTISVYPENSSYQMFAR